MRWTSLPTDKEIARHLRAKAAKYLQMADMLDGEDLGRGLMSLVQGNARPSASHITAETVKQLIKLGNYRVNGLASALSVAPEIVREIIDDPASGLTDEDRGWIREK